MNHYYIRYVYSVALRIEYIITWRKVGPYSQMEWGFLQPLNADLETRNGIDNMQHVFDLPVRACKV
jgi:hypothetical protein